MVGYCAIGRLLMESRPASTMMSATTHANTGLSTKNLAMSENSPGLLGRCWRCGWSRRLCSCGTKRNGLHRSTGLYVLEAFHNHLLAALETTSHYPVIALRIAHRHRL